MHEFHTSRTIEFSDTDAGGVVHFARFFIFMETAEDQFLRSLGASFSHDPEGNAFLWPKAAVSCEYKSPARYGDELQIHLKVARVGQRSVTYEFRFRRGEDEIAAGRTTSVCCVERPDGGFQSIAIPTSLPIEEA